MSQFLTKETFDQFLLEEAVISTANTYTIDGHINREFYPAEERGTDILPYALQPWSEIKGLCYDLIKGKHTPLYFKFVLQLKPDEATALLERNHCERMNAQLKALVLTIRFDGTHATATSGTSYQTFVPDKEVDQIWDRELQHFLADHQIPFEPLI